MDEILNKIGTDKVLHFLVGAVIAFSVSNMMMLQEGTVGTDNLWVAIGGIVVAMIFEFFKEFIIDSKPDWKDILATFLGGAFVFVVNAFGILLNVLSE